MTPRSTAVGSEPGAQAKAARSTPPRPATSAVDPAVAPHPPDATTYHEGELSVQEAMGVRKIAALRSQKRSLGQPAQAFLSKLPYVAISAHDAEGRMFCTMVTSSDGGGVLADLTASSLVLRAGTISPGDALQGALVPGTAVGIIGIDMAVRARVRCNCSVREVAENGDVRLDVELCASHCPQYIRQRGYQPSGTASGEVKGRHGAMEAPRSASAAPALAPHQPLPASLEDQEIRSLIDGADTFFIGSSYGRKEEDFDFRHGADASNRSGAPGFVRVTGPDTLSFDNYNGNQMYNTLGNITRDPRVGLLFPSWNGDMLQISGRAAIDFAPEQQKGGERVMQVVVVRVESVKKVAMASPGTWTLAPSRPLVIAKKVEESESVVSFHLKAPPSSPGLAPFEPGQHMPVQINGLNRSYSISGGGGDFYRITVKKMGAVSSALHELSEGDEVECFPPAGNFGPASLPAGSDVDGVVLVAAGVGITPMIPMAHASSLPTAVVHAVKNGKQWPFRRELQEVAAAPGAPTMKLRAFLSRPCDQDMAEEKEGRGWEVERRRVVAEDLLQAAKDLGSSRPLFCFCGPLAFSAPMQAALEEAGVPAANIKSESFG